MTFFSCCSVYLLSQILSLCFLCLEKNQNTRELQQEPVILVTLVIEIFNRKIPPYPLIFFFFNLVLHCLEIVLEEFDANGEKGVVSYSNSFLRSEHVHL